MSNTQNTLSQTPVSAGIARNAEVFEGLYESLYCAVTQRQTDTEAYEEWCDRVALINRGKLQKIYRLVIFPGRPKGITKEIRDLRLEW